MSDHSDPILTGADSFFPAPQFRNSAIGYLESKINSTVNPTDPRPTSPRIVAIGEHHTGGGALIRHPRCLRDFIADFIIYMNEEHNGSRRPKRPRVLALELAEDRYGTTPFTSFTPPPSILEREHTRATPTMLSGTTVSRPVINARSLWLSRLTPDISLRDMLLKIATKVATRHLYVTGVDAPFDLARRPSVHLTLNPSVVPNPPFPSFALNMTDLGRVRDAVMAERLCRLATKIMHSPNDLSLDSTAASDGVILTVMGAAHVSKLPPSVYDTSDTRRDQSMGSIGGEDPFGAYFLRNASMNERIPVELRQFFASYTSLNCIGEFANNRMPPGYLTRINTDEFGHWGWDDVDIGMARAYDLLSSYFYSYNGGIDLQEFESTMTSYRFPLSHMTTGPSGRTPLSRLYDGCLFFRRMDSWHPLDDLIFRAVSTTERPSKFYIEGVDQESRSTWEERWTQFERSPDSSDAFRDPGRFGERRTPRRSLPPRDGSHDFRPSRDNPVLPSPSALAGTEGYENFGYRRISFVLPRSTHPRWAILIIGYGFMQRPLDEYELAVSLVDSSVNPLSPTVWTLPTGLVQVISDTMIVVRLPSAEQCNGLLARPITLGIRVIFQHNEYDAFYRRELNYYRQIDSAIDVTPLGGGR